MSTSNTKIDLYTAGTPNGHKVHFALEELGLNYTTHHIDISKNEQKKEWFLKICPNGRIPAIVDHTDGKDLPLMEGAAILLYLTERYDKSHQISFPHDSDEYWTMVEWIVWMQSGIGPMQGQANHFYRYAPEKIEYGINRYQTETKRLYQVLDDRLAAQHKEGKGLWIVGGKYTIADMACFSWINWAEWAGVDVSPFSNIVKWTEEIRKRPATERAVNIPEPFKLREIMKSKEAADDYAKYNSQWVMQGAQADQERHGKQAGGMAGAV